MRKFTAAFFVAALLCASLPLSAHEGPEHEIEELTERMKRNGETAELLTERAVEYRVLGKLPEATKDLELALTYAPDSVGAHCELARVFFLGGKASEALTTIARGLTVKTDDPSDYAALRMLRAEIFRSQNEHKKALEDCDTGLRLHKANPEWYLLRSDVQRRLKMHQERIAGLEDGIRETGAGILEIERIEAQMDAGQWAAALKMIETELDDSRIKSSWLIRRARAFIGLGKRTEADADLKAAMEEISARIDLKNPDAPLLLDKALIYELLGEKKDALRAYEEARDKGAADGVNDKIKALKELLPKTN
jgi:tetratricopeptide (TPR) repeat protein